MLTGEQRAMALAAKALNAVAADMGLVARQPRYRYYRGNEKHKEDRYFWTTETLNRGGKRRYVAGIYRYLKTKKQWKLIIERTFAKKYRAKERARTWALAGR